MRAASKVGVMYSSPDLREPDDIGTHCSLHCASVVMLLHIQDQSFVVPPNGVFRPQPYFGRYANFVLNNYKNLNVYVQVDILNLTSTK